MELKHEREGLDAPCHWESFNRTSMELKHLIDNPVHRPLETFNRTSMELKRRMRYIRRVNKTSFNRTSMELKRYYPYLPPREHPADF